MPLIDDGLDEIEADAPEGALAEGEARVLVTFRLAEQVFAVDVAWVREVLDLCAVAPMPGAPHDVLGMIDLREEPIAILDLAGRLGLPAAGGVEARILVLTFGAGDDAVSLGVVADQVLRVCEAPRAAVEPMPETRTGWRSAEIEGLVRTEDGAALLLAVERIICRDAATPGEFDFG
jgi:purine-binding chemotaxis protein CheW